MVFVAAQPSDGERLGQNSARSAGFFSPRSGYTRKAKGCKRPDQTGTCGEHFFILIIRARCLTCKCARHNLMPPCPSGGSCCPCSHMASFHHGTPTRSAYALWLSPKACRANKCCLAGVSACGNGS